MVNESSPPVTGPAGVRRHRVRRALRVLGRVVVFAAAAVLGVAVAAVAFVAVAQLTTSVGAGVAAGLLALVVVTGGPAWLATRRSPRRRGVTAGFAGGLAVVVAAVAAVTVFRPVDHPYVPARPTPATRYWTLPDGDRVAYTHTPATGRPAGPPVVFLHGGPGMPGEPGGAVLSGADGLARAGFDVYVYDQVGSGLSSRPADARDNTVAHQVADLEAIRRQIGADRMILIGHSWGATLAAHYLAAHPEGVARVVFEAPGPIWAPAHPQDRTPESEARRTAAQRARQSELITPRVLLAALLGGGNPQAGRNFAGDREMDALMAQQVPTLPSFRCGPDPDLQAPPGLGFWANMAINSSLREVADPRPRLRDRRVPALVLRPECDYIPWAVAREYRDVLAGATLVWVPDAGHIVQLDQPQLLLATVAAFLRDERLPLPAHTAAEPPA